MDQYAKSAMVRDSRASLTVAQVVDLVDRDVGGTHTAAEIHAAILSGHPDVDLVKAPGHLPRSPRGRYDLRPVRATELRERATILMCIGTDFERGSLADLLRMPQEVEAEDEDVKIATVEFDPTF